MVKKELYKRSSLQKLVIRLGLDQEEADELKKLFYVMQFLDRKPKNDYESEKLKRILAHQPYDDLRNDEPKFDCWMDDDYIRNNLNFIPKLCIIFTAGNNDNYLYADGKAVILILFIHLIKLVHRKNNCNDIEMNIIQITLILFIMLHLKDQRKKKLSQLTNIFL